MYSIKIGENKIGYINEKQDIENYINSSLEKEKNIAFMEMKKPIEYELQLVSRNEENSIEGIKKQIEDNIDIEYTTYAITYNKEEKIYLSSEEEAQEVIETIKENDSKNTQKLGILQVYSEDLEKIKPVDLKTATSKINNVIKQDKKSSTIKVAKVVENDALVASKTTVNGVSFTVKPLNGTITSRFGSRTSPGGIGSTNHKGLDIAAKTGTAIKATASGTVKVAGYKGSLGNLVIIESGKGVETYYGHCSKLYVSKGQKVKAGDKIAAVGQTGTATGPHLHLEIHVNGTAVNPQKYVYK